MKTNTSSKDKKTLRREQILDKASLIFAEKGYRQTDLQEVADLLGIGKGTIYRNFKTKEELFLSTVARGIEDLQEQMNGILPSCQTPLEKTFTAIKTYLLFFEENPHVVELIIQERAEFKQREKPTYFEYFNKSIVKWKAFLEELLEENQTPQTLSVDSILYILSNLMYGTMFTIYFRGRQQSIDEEVKELMIFILASLFNNKLDNDLKRKIDKL